MAHPISDRIPIVTPFAIHFFWMAASWFTIAVCVFGFVRIMLLAANGHNAYEQCQKNDGYNNEEKLITLW